MRPRTLALALAGILTLAGGLAAQAFTVSGTFQYQDKEWNFSGWTGVDPLKPIRRADIYVLNNLTQAVLGMGYTEADGSFSVACTAAGPDCAISRASACAAVRTSASGTSSSARPML